MRPGSQESADGVLQVRWRNQVEVANSAGNWRQERNDVSTARLQLLTSVDSVLPVRPMMDLGLWFGPLNVDTTIL